MYNALYCERSARQGREETDRLTSGNRNARTIVRTTTADAVFVMLHLGNYTASNALGHALGAGYNDEAVLGDILRKDSTTAGGTGFSFFYRHSVSITTRCRRRKAAVLTVIAVSGI